MAERKKAGGRAIWYGTLSFGLVSVPVGVTKAQGRQEISFVQLHKDCGERIKMPKSCPTHGVLNQDQIAKGWEWSKEEYIEVNEDDLDALLPLGGKTISIERFVAVDSVDPIYHDRTYYLTPAKESAERQGYRLLLDAMRESETAAIARFVLWGKENLCSVRPSPDGMDVLAMDILFRAEDVRDPTEIGGELAGIKTTAAEKKLARQLVESLREDTFDPAAYPDKHRDDVRALLDNLANGKQPAKPTARVATKETPDLLAGLKASLDATTKKTRTKPTRSTAKGKQIAAKARARR